MRRALVLTSAVAAISVAMGGPARGDAWPWPLREITHNSYPDESPRIHNGEITWIGEPGTNYHVYYWDGSSTQQVTNIWSSFNDEWGPQIYNGQIAWYDEMDQIYFWDGSSTTTPPGGGYSWDPQIHDGELTWMMFGYGQLEVYFWDGSSTTRLTDTEGDDWWPMIHEGQVAWYGYDGNDYEIYFWDGTFTGGDPNITQVTSNSYYDGYPKIHNGELAWYSTQGSNCTVHHWDGSTVTDLGTFSFPGVGPTPGGYEALCQIDNGQVVWEGYDGAMNDTEIFYWDGTFTGSTPNVTQMTSNSYNDWGAELHNGQFVWSGNAEIYYWDGGTLYQVTDNSWADAWPDIWNGQITWVSAWEGGDYEIMETYVPEPGTVAMFGIGVAGLLVRVRRRRRSQ